MRSIDNLFRITNAIRGGKSMTMFLILIMMFASVLVGSIIQQRCMIDNKTKSENTVYIFSQELLDKDLDMLKMERISGDIVTLENMKNRGSVRIAQGLVFDEADFEKIRSEEYLKELP